MVQWAVLPAGSCWIKLLLVHELESHESFYFVFYYKNCIIRIRITQFVLYKLYNTNSYKFIQFLYKLYSTNSYTVWFLYEFIQFLYKVYSTNSYKVWFCFSLCSTSREREARAASAQRKLQGQSPSWERVARAAIAHPKLTSYPNQAAPGCPDH